MRETAGLRAVSSLAGLTPLNLTRVPRGDGRRLSDAPVWVLGCGGGSAAVVGAPRTLTTHPFSSYPRYASLSLSLSLSLDTNAPVWVLGCGGGSAAVVGAPRTLTTHPFSSCPRNALSALAASISPSIIFILSCVASSARCSCVSAPRVALSSHLFSISDGTCTWRVGGQSMAHL